MKLLVEEFGANVNHQAHDGSTPLLEFAESEEPFLELIRQKADVNIQDKKGQTALHLVQDPDLAEALLEAGALPDIQNNHGKTPFEMHANNPLILEVLYRWKSAQEKTKLNESLEPRAQNKTSGRI